MQKVFVLDKNQKPLMPCHPAHARKLLKKGKAKVFRMYPFAIILIDREGGEVQDVELKVDPGSKTTGIAIVSNKKVVWAANLNHRGYHIKKLLDKRRVIRRSRRSRKTRYRQPRFDNRTRPKGWLPPSIQSRVDNVFNWTSRLIRFVPISEIQVETVRFDTQKMENPEISGVEYQQGTLYGYELREYLLQKWSRKCAYCSAENVPLEIEHIIPKSKGGTDRPSNLTIACHQCNQKKSNKDIRVFLRNKPNLLKKILNQCKAGLKDSAAVNVTRYAIGRKVKSFGLPVSFWSGGRTKFNRSQQGYVKDHWIDAACVGTTGEQVEISEGLKPLVITAQGRGSRQKCRVDKYGFPRSKPKQFKRVKGFQTGDIVEAIVPKGKRQGRHFGRVVIRSNGSFNIKTADETIQGISWKYFNLIQLVDGYAYAKKNKKH